MRTSRCFFLAPPALALLAALSVPAAAQQTSGTGLVADLLAQLEEAEQKMVQLANAIPAEKYDWRPAEGVRSVGEVFLHLAADNYMLPTVVGATPPAATGIKAGDWNSVGAYEQRKLAKDAVIQELEQSFAFVKKAISETPESKLSDKIDLFGSEGTVRRLWVLTTTHVHEHLGQMIAYARSNNVVPPWSRQGG